MAVSVTNRAATTPGVTSLVSAAGSADSVSRVVMMSGNCARVDGSAGRLGRYQVNKTTQVEVFLGEPIVHDSERAFLARLHADLVRRGCSARIHANFLTRSSQRQVDFLVVTKHRLVHAELKTVDQSLPLIGGINGPWSQELPGGRQRSLERNFCRQAHDTTYAISDDMHELARRSEVPRVSGKYYGQFQTVVCINPDIPAGSRLDPYRHVDVVGYQQLLDLLITDGPRPAWTDEHWDAFARQLQLVPDRPDSPAQAARRATIAALDDYRRRFVALHQRDLHEYVPVPARLTDQTLSDPVPVLIDAAVAQRVVTFSGPSGAGKSHAVRHAAVAAAANGAVPIWVRCGEYQRGRFSHALSRAVAPFTTESCLPLLRQASDIGSPTVVILDGLNECVPADRAELLEQLDALRLRMSVAAIITSSISTGLPSPDVGLTAVKPDDDAREALIASYGRPDGLEGAEAFQTPMELALAVECGEQLRPGATGSELFDVYVGRICPTERTRGGLRRLAVEMDRQLRGSLTIAEIRALLHRDAAASAPEADVDAVLSSPLLSLTQGRAAFRHDVFARFLTAEHLVLHADGSAVLADTLREPQHADLSTHAVALEQVPGRRRDLLLALADPALLSAAARGSFGHEAEGAIRAEVVALLAESTVATPNAQLIREAGEPDQMFDGHWQVAVPRTKSQQALLHVAGVCLAEGLFLDETARLLDATDRLCAEQMRRMHDDGHRAAISAVVRATYSGFYYTDERELQKLPASVVINACEHSRFTRHCEVLTPSPAQAMWDNPMLTPPRWGRLTATLILLNRDDPADHKLLPDVFAAAWAANGYHLRLTALMTATEYAQAVDDTTRDRMRAALDDCDTNNIFLKSSLFETLAAYGGIEPLNTEESILAHIEAILAVPDDPDAWGAARGVVGMVFEDQNLHGPYTDVLSDLAPADYLRLHVMAARSEDFPFNRDWLMNAIVERLDYADDDAKAVLRDGVLTMDWASPFREETVGAHLIALRGWAAIADEMPPAADYGGRIERRAWRIVDELLFVLLRDTQAADREPVALWSELLDLCAPAAVDVLAHLKAARTWEYNSADPGMYDRLLTRWPDQMRQLIEWAVRNPERLRATFENGPARNPRQRLIEDLAVVGTDDTAALLQSYVSDTDIGDAAVNAIRRIKRRGELL